jgi:pyruvate/2-oxoglutarate dehydrogenase complex dihydrolipoamide acyltransferase (E2) component
MKIEVEVPDLGPDGGDQATVVEWHCEEGESVEKGEFLCELESEGNMIEIMSPAKGILIECIVEEDEIVRIGETLGIVESSDDEEQDS